MGEKSAIFQRVRATGVRGRKAHIVNGGGKQMFHSHVRRVMNSPHNDSRMCRVERQRGGGRENKTEAGE